MTHGFRRSNNSRIFSQTFFYAGFIPIELCESWRILIASCQPTYGGNQCWRGSCLGDAKLPGAAFGVSMCMGPAMVWGRDLKRG